MHKFNPYTNVYYDVSHMFATITFYLKYDSFYKSNDNKEYNSFPDFGGWGGDFITLYNEYNVSYKNEYPIEKVGNGKDVNDFMNEYCGGNKLSSYSIEDYYADTDALNIISEAITSSGDMLFDAVSKYYNSIDSATNIFNRYYQNRFSSDEELMKIVVKNLIHLCEFNEGGNTPIYSVNYATKALFGGEMAGILTPIEEDIYIKAYINNLLKRKK